MQEAWDAFVAAYAKREGGSEEDRNSQWFTILHEMFGDRQPEQLTPTEWGRMLAKAPGRILPF